MAIAITEYQISLEVNYFQVLQHKGTLRLPMQNLKMAVFLVLLYLKIVWKFYRNWVENILPLFAYKCQIHKILSCVIPSKFLRTYRNL